MIQLWVGLPRLQETHRLTETLDRMFGPDAPVDPAHTGTAIEVLLHVSGYLAAAVEHGRVAVNTPAETARLLHALDQAVTDLAHVTGQLPGSHQPLTDAATRLAEACRLFRDAYLSIHH
ncbi:hypothetical protein GCM10010112_82730 [Actinoplanes lobatus]|uniref:Uncharacterized protein YbgA (DUF1722 family) n=1 Tax=Actinoplanes lobatus TaxID=113568 RepID=A0A7W7MJF9_9ACTN|nr:hypothetical protein [Actinoplanes lobatus]MBB4752539.1 uncharacterized protein YbgA (DUF1722 family) [Actinoplanes lobatus]GGN93917.1 hypothetical protein GCM10010112_82730 [Actinoplanes lobatus]GIE44838.1 hypothetical protein Alo02nite_77360 [Actinoplanes lobatus]